MLRLRYVCLVYWLTVYAQMAACTDSVPDRAEAPGVPATGSPSVQGDGGISAFPASHADQESDASDAGKPGSAAGISDIGIMEGEGEMRTTEDGGCVARAPHAGPFRRIYDPGVGEQAAWYINDHTVVRGPDSQWHLFGITHAEPGEPLDETQFAHAVSATLTASQWTKLPPALKADRSFGEELLWAPHVIRHDGLYYMFYCAGGSDRERYQIRLATSEDLMVWKREPQPLFEDGYDARDPYVLRVGERWIMYYTATSKPGGGAHVVAYRSSRDLRHWSERAIAYEDSSKGTAGGPTESPFVVVRDEGYYLFMGPWRSYVSTQVLFSHDPLHFEGPPIAEIPAHALEVVRDTDGVDYVTRAGWGQGGVDIARLSWPCPAF